MSQIPRRTAEFQQATSSVRKSTNHRSSRISQNVPSSVSRPGFISRTSATPMRSTSRSNLNIVTPNQKDRYSTIPQTAEKEKPPTEDRQFVFERTQFVLEELARLNVPEFNEIINKGFKTMTLKQFILILQHLIKPICGNITLDTTNYIDYISNFLQCIEYPFTNLSKSTLKTPAAPHCQNAVILFLAWLAEFSNANIEDSMHYAEGDLFPSSGLSRQFMCQTGDAFKRWNNQEDGADAIADEIILNYIETQTQGSSDIEGDVRKLKEKIDNLQNEIRPESVNGSFIKKREESKSLSKTIDELVKSINDLITKCKIEKSSTESQYKLMDQLTSDIDKLRVQITKQGMTINEKLQSLKEIAQMRVLLTNEKEQAQNMLEEGSEKEIYLSNVIQRKFQMVEEINNSLYKLTCDLESVGMRGFDPKRFEIKKTKIRDVEQLNNELTSLSQSLHDVKSQFDIKGESLVKVKIEEIEKKRHLLSEVEIKSTECAKQKEIFNTIDEAIVKIENETVEIVKTNMQKNNLNIIKLKELNENITKTTESIREFGDTVAQLRDQRAKFSEFAKGKCQELLEHRKEIHNKKQKEVDALRAIIRQFGKGKPFSESTQNILDKVMHEAKD